MLRSDRHQFLGSFLKNSPVAAKLVKDRVDVQSERQCIGMRQLACPSQRASALGQRLIRLSQQLKCPGDEALAGNARIVGRQLWRSVLGLVIEIERLSQMAKRTAEFATKHKADAQVPVRRQLGLAVVSAFRKLKQFVCQFMTGTDFCAIEQVREGAGPGYRNLCSLRRVAAQLHRPPARPTPWLP